MHKNIFSTIVPKYCVTCDRHIACSSECEQLCEACYMDLPWLNHACKGCGALFNDELKDQDYCANCLTKPQSYDNYYGLFQYQTPIKQFITALKFHEKLIYGQLFAKIISHKIKHQWYTHDDLPEIILPVPLHKKRLQQRGFNQALEIAKPIAKQLNIPISKYHCIRAKPTAAQSELPLKKRKQNIKNAFILKSPLAVKHIALIDDVVTSGNTVSELAKLLKKSGVQRVDVWSCAKT